VLGLSWGSPPDHDRCECPPHWTEIDRPLWIARTEVTRAQYAKFDMEQAGLGLARTPDFPVGVSWAEPSGFRFSCCMSPTCEWSFSRRPVGVPSWIACAPARTRERSWTGSALNSAAFAGRRTSSTTTAWRVGSPKGNGSASVRPFLPKKRVLSEASRRRRRICSPTRWGQGGHREFSRSLPTSLACSPHWTPLGRTTPGA